jgi:hypothetical protein
LRHGSRYRRNRFLFKIVKNRTSEGGPIRGGYQVGLTHARRNIRERLWVDI